MADLPEVVLTMRFQRCRLGVWLLAQGVSSIRELRVFWQEASP